MRCDRDSFRWWTTIITLILEGITAVDGRAICDLLEGRTARPPESSRTNIGNVSTLDDTVAAFNPLCVCPIPNASRLAPQAR
jgi:hypothetical protein